MELVPFKESTEIQKSISCLFDEYNARKNKMIDISSFMNEKSGDVIEYYLSANSAQNRYTVKDLFELEPAIKCLDSDFWSQVINMTDVKECMPAKDRNAWHEQISSKNVPAFERETVLNTLQMLLLQRGDFFAKKVDGVFQRLSREHVTNSPMAFKARMIINGAVDTRFLSSNYQAAEYIADLRSVISQLMGRGVPKWDTTSSDLHQICNKKEFGKWFDFEGGAFRLKLFKVGTAHVEVHPEIANKLNLVLAQLYPSVIAEKENKRSKTKPKSEIPLYNDLLDSATLYCIRDAYRKYDNKTNSVIPGDRSEEFISVMEDLGAVNEGDWKFTFDYDASETLRYISRMGVVPNRQAYQFYPTPESIAEQMVYLLDNGSIIRNGRNILEPSAGTGNLISMLKEYDKHCKVVAVEVSEVRAKILNEKFGKSGVDVYCRDFLNLGDLKLIKDFDRVIMNPPFSKNQAKAHIIESFSYLKKGGVLVACIPASLKGVRLVGDEHKYYWSETMEDEFENTKVRTVLMQIIKLENN